MSTDRVMLLIDADNVSVDVIEQAVTRLLDEYGALHVRRAYCTAESALKHQQLFKRLSIKPMVNLAAGKNSTDIALAVDAIDLVLAERPEVVVIASSDSDFAPLVSRLREKGCRVRGIGQEGKTGDETLQVYDTFDVLEHRSRAASASARSPARKTAARKSTAAAAVADAPAPTKTTARKAATKKTATTKTPRTSTRAGTGTGTSTRTSTRTMTRGTPRKSSAKAALEAPPAVETEVLAVAVREPAHERLREAVPEAVAELFRALPALARGDTVELQKAAEQLRRSRLLSRSSSALKLFGRFPDWFDLQPAADPKRVTARKTAEG